MTQFGQQKSLQYVDCTRQAARDFYLRQSFQRRKSLYSTGTRAGCRCQHSPFHTSECLLIRLNTRKFEATL